MNAETAKAAINQIVNVICESVEDSGPHGIPSGHIYAALMGKVSFEVYQKIEALAIQTGRIQRSASHLLTPTGAKG